jgi:site-specific DNA recombinase
MIARVWKKAKEADSKLREREVVTAMKMLDPIWDELFPKERNRLLHLLVERVVLTTDNLEFRIRVDGINNLVNELSDSKEERSIA